MTTVGDMLYQFGGVPVLGELTTGKVFFVDSTTGSNSNDGRSPETAVATADAATNLCTADKGDFVYFMPNHAETLGTATSFAPDVAGVTYVGLGKGSNAPEFTFSATDSEITIGAANVTFRNMRFIAGISAVVIGIDVNADYFTMDGCTTDYGASTYDFVDHVDFNTTDYGVIKNCRFIAENATAGANTAIQLIDAQFVTITGNYFSGYFAEAPIWNPSGTAGVSYLIADNIIYNDDTTNADNCISLQTACTGVIARNLCGSLYDTNVTTLIDPGSSLNFDNFFCNGVDNHAMILNPGTIST